MGNSSGGLKEYWDIFYSGTNAQGAFVWDWVDQGIRLPVPRRVPGEHRGDATSSPTADGGKTRRGIRNDNDFNNNGLVAADRTPHPGPVRDQVRLPQSARLGGGSGATGRIRVKNWFDFTNPKDRRRRQLGGEGGRPDDRARRVPGARYRAAARRRSSHLPLPTIDAGARRRVLAECQLRAEGRHAVGADGARDRVGPVRAAVEDRRCGNTAPHQPAICASCDDAGVAWFSGSDWCAPLRQGDGDDLDPGSTRATCWSAVRVPTSGAPPPTTTRRLEIGARFGGASGRATFDVWPWRAASGDVGRAGTTKVGAAGRRDSEADGHRRPAVVGATYTMTYTIHGTATSSSTTATSPARRRFAMMPRFGTELVRRRRPRETSPGTAAVRTRPMIDRQFERIGVYKHHGRQGVGGVHAAAGERQQDRRPLGGADECRRRRPPGGGRPPAERHGAALTPRTTWSAPATRSRCSATPRCT